MDGKCCICSGLSPEFTAVCGHQYHNICLKLWNEHNYKCPECISLKPSSKAIFSAIHRDDLATFMKCLESGDFAEPNEDGLYPIHVCTLLQKPNFINALLERGVDINQSSFELSPLQYACEWGNVKMVEYLVGKGADVSKQNYKQNAPLAFAMDIGNMDLVKLLLNAGANVNGSDSKGYSLLIHAVMLDNFDLARLLVGKGAKIYSDDAVVTSAYHFAIYKQRLDIMLYFEEHGADPSKCFESNLMSCQSHGENLEITIHILASRDRVPNAEKSITAALRSAISADNISLLKLLLEHGADMHEADRDGKPAILLAAERNAARCLRHLIDAGADLRATTKSGLDLLSSAAAMGAMDACRILMEHGANPTAQNSKTGYTALMHACEKRKLETIQVIIEKMLALGQPEAINLQSKGGKTSIITAAESRYMPAVKLLADSGADLYVKDRSGRTVLDILSTHEKDTYEYLVNFK